MKQTALTKERVFSYDTRRFNFAELIQDILLADMADPALSLEHIHRLDKAKSSHLLTFASDQNLYFHNKYYDSPKLPKLLAAYRDFVSTVIAPQFADDQLIVQAKPTFRIHLPNNTAIPSDTGGDPSRPGLHCDADYNHPDVEFNFWVPFTQCLPDNTLHLESAPGKGDFRPMLLNNGQVLRFWGARCMHHNKINAQGPTRVSFDFRVMNKSDWDAISPTWRERVATVQRRIKFTLGNYYMLYNKNTQRFSHHETVEETISLPKPWVASGYASSVMAR
ncbi:hypothetical protein [Leptothoe kymatousa]|uniref:2OG-Fe(II) oxygenase n=1 Tax=Leptothoe kymatousa TAU-MAC 1615 TaxID=2364775 RepID=A0ABS5XZ81_9CYAN|nr:hypothetical protein [Leptothoe kymatousa]MBT9310890.1 hypothetical protein [Leptothoe kymatousa TAU-MAC 1615]